MKIVTILLLVAGIIAAVLVGQTAGQYLGDMQTSSYWDAVPRMVASACFVLGFFGMMVGIVYHNFSPDGHYKYGLTVIALSACGIGVSGGWDMVTFRYEEEFGSFLFNSGTGYMTLVLVATSVAACIYREFREPNLF